MTEEDFVGTLDHFTDYYDKLSFIYPSWPSNLILEITEYCCTHPQHNTSTDELKWRALCYLNSRKEEEASY